MASRLGNQTVCFSTRPAILGFGSVAGKKEGEGPLANRFDSVNTDISFGEKTWEKAESAMQKMALTYALDKAGISPSLLNYIFAGDLLNQSISSSFAMKDFTAPFVGLFGACSTMAETLSVASVFCDSGAAQFAAAITSSHFCTAERQFRFPLEYGGQRAPTSQWTATASGAVILGTCDQAPHIKAVTLGKIVDLGVTDANNMGAAMAPAAADTLEAYFKDTGNTPDQFDLIVTGDLGKLGSEAMRTLLKRENIHLGDNYNDCGMMLYDPDDNDVACGASGCGCSASVLCSTIIPEIIAGNLKRVLFVATGALMSTTSSQQGGTIPSIAHLVELAGPDMA